jgi:hypothetical protein
MLDLLDLALSFNRGLLLLFLFGLLPPLGLFNFPLLLQLRYHLPVLGIFLCLLLLHLFLYFLLLLLLLQLLYLLLCKVRLYELLVRGVTALLLLWQCHRFRRHIHSADVHVEVHRRSHGGCRHIHLPFILLLVVEIVKQQVLLIYWLLTVRGLHGRSKVHIVIAIVELQLTALPRVFNTAIPFKRLIVLLAFFVFI